MYPSGYRYSKEHEWVAVEGDTATVGITDFAQQELGDIVYVELPEIGKSVRAGEVLGTVESVKAVSEIYAPLTGEVVEANSALNEAPETINRAPHAEGWICKLRIAAPDEVEALMDAAAYEHHVAESPAES
jgi:glycine cleavage system H protein